MPAPIITKSNNKTTKNEATNLAQAPTDPAKHPQPRQAPTDKPRHAPTVKRFE